VGDGAAQAVPGRTETARAQGAQCRGAGPREHREIRRCIERCRRQRRPVPEEDRQGDGLMELQKAEELTRRLAAALRGTELYSPAHPLVQRGIDALAAAATERLQAAPAIVVGFIGDEVVVDGTRLPRGTASLIGFARDLRDRGIEKITLSRGLSRAEV